MNDDNGSDARSILLGRIEDWSSRTWTWRIFNLVIFALIRVFTPIGSFLVAANLLTATHGSPFISDVVMLVIAMLVTVMVGLDSLLNPAAKKRIAFQRNNDLRALEYKLRLQSVGKGDEELRGVLAEANDELRQILNSYVQEGY